MNLVFDDIHWMFFNVALALIPVLLGLLISLFRIRFIQLAIGVIWLFFLPNTIYLIADLTHFFEAKYSSSIWVFFVSLILYTVLLLLGIITFILALYPIDALLHSFLKREKRITLLVILNLLVGVGTIMGRTERTNSWEILVHPILVLHSIVSVFTQSELLTAALIWGIGANVLYFSLKQRVYNIMIFNTTKRR